MSTELIKETTELVKIVNGWKTSIDNLAIINDCGIVNLIGDNKGELGQIYKQISKINEVRSKNAHIPLDSNKDIQIAVDYLKNNGGMCDWEDATPEMSERMFYASMKGVIESFPETGTWAIL